MPYDTGAPGAETDASNPIRRGPLRPSRLASARSRLGGDALARLIQGSDLVLLAGLLDMRWMAHVTGGQFLLLLAASALVAGALASFDAYQLSARERLHRHLYRVIGAVGGAGLMMLTLVSVTSPEARDANILTIVDWCLKAVAVLGAAHLAWFAYIRRLRRQGFLTPNLIIVGATPAAERLVSAALASREVNILGIFDDRGQRAPRHIFGVPVLGRTAQVKDHRLLPFVDRIVVAVPSGATARIAQLLHDLAPVPNAVSLLMDGFEAADERAAHERLLEMPLAHLAGAQRGALQAVLKRVVDVSFSIGGLIVLAPALVAIAIAIRLDSPGPILFKQRRHGYLNEEVVVWKFRSMKTEMSDYAAARQVTADDDRVTKVGRFLRRTSLDELPQLWNVIRGEMSLVGPRPHAIGMLAEGKEASKLVETYAHRHRMKPGLTGWAAINGSRGPADTPEAIRRRVALDLEYVERQSVWFDLAIIFKTLPCVLGDTETVR
ncbi:exopolysaccharide biosynthesis polyprenyl glycosylphosphotransferase [Phenylobacterium sp.]|jgi:Undecaprenyl-phosphate glucose phosphotransferase|uniref:exopolysaccharide biosynthesis polyprenyl glycosylphosphotransferase n=1 Tax=Phenylobacterium sp. TaxID=1871053 RepID=UPI002F41825A